MDGQVHSGDLPPCGSPGVTGQERQGGRGAPFPHSALLPGEASEGTTNSPTPLGESQDSPAPLLQNAQSTDAWLTDTRPVQAQANESELCFKCSWLHLKLAPGGAGPGVFLFYALTATWKQPTIILRQFVISQVWSFLRDNFKTEPWMLQIHPRFRFNVSGKSLP